MERYKKIVLEAPEGNAFVVSQEHGGELRIKLIPTIATECSENYTNPPIPEGWEHVEGKWSNGFVIQDFKGNQFVWVPVGFLDANGTLDGTNFSEKFGRRDYEDNEFYNGNFDEKLEEELRKQWESVQKCGGFYISRYNISKNKQTGDAQSVKGEMPWTNIDWNDSMKAAKTFGDGISVTSHLPFGAEYDSVLEWFIKSDARTKEEIADDSTHWGNFYTTKNSLAKTGTRKAWSTNHICDFAGNVEEWTQEQYKSYKGPYRVIRGGDYRKYGCNSPVANRSYDDLFYRYSSIGFRAVLYLA